ncbi:uncharacterized protein LOC126401515 [Epinephelus moara]|uniref:uncharacterized protein LOC126401515 n=1 Tax=Epinephelus moara TaxID=300413 RepID=UPI00214F2707|nr:uncharacterized protein LOC126401515 [Epinephelus moara]XP_049918801.1 uncharacterized protein LOC126401515 [Epinephelus moara]
MKIMEEGMKKDANNSWTAPLPFKSPRQSLPNNRPQAMNRLMSLIRNFDRKPEMRDHFVAFMEKIFQNGHAEIAPPLKEDEERWYLPLFGVHHPKKPKQIRVVFDSSAQYKGLSLNDVLLKGPDLNNSLLGVLMRFRKEAVAFTADIEHMFYCFYVREEDRNFLCFLWFHDNNLSNDIIEYRMKVHVFGNSPSPAVAIFGLHQSVQCFETDLDPDVQLFVTRDFYVDDGLKSLATVETAVSLLRKTRDVLAKSNLRLHKIAANRKEILEAFPSQDHAKDLKDLDPEADALPMQRSLGLLWDLKRDCFTFNVSDETKPFTRRGVLSTINSLYDPLGFVAPVTIHGKSILRELTSDNGDWDAPLPQRMEESWVLWRESLRALSNVSIARTYTNISPSEAARRELCIFCDALTKAIAAVAYLKVTDAGGNCEVGFVMGKAKLTPRPEQTIPRLELCAAVLAVELTDLVSGELDIHLNDTHFYTDSKVVLGYIYNETRRFYVYVSNRVARIRRSSRANQWQYVPTDQDPADLATRSVPAHQLMLTNWFTGPKFLCQDNQSQCTYDLVEPSPDGDIRLQVSALKTTTEVNQLGSQRMTKFSRWSSLIRAIARLLHIVHAFRSGTSKDSFCKGWHHCGTGVTVEESEQAKNIVIRSVQEETYTEEIKCIIEQREIPKGSPIKNLDPFIDDQGLLRVGGRIREADLSQAEKNPLIVPGQHHVASLIVKHCHEQTLHQGRLYTEGAVRSAGWWIVGGKRRVSNVIHHCVKCRRLRAPLCVQKMANLPAQRLSTDPPFTNVGLDVFGPWNVFTQRTRGGVVQNKRWAVIFTCLSMRAVHIEVIESLDTSSFINSLKRFLAIRGPVKSIYSDRGTNFVCVACKELQIPSNINNTAVRTYLLGKGCSWTFNPPHASHFGGSWERMMGLARRILDSMFLDLKTTKLTHEVLVTFMAEVSAIINSRPLVPVSTDPTDPFILSPVVLLTQKVGPLSAPAGSFVASDLYKNQWRQVQHLANVFWDKWRRQFLSTLQPRRKWQSSQPNVSPGTVVVLKDIQSPRHEWPLGLVTKVFPSTDGKVWTVEIKVAGSHGTKIFTRPIADIAVLVPPEP